MRRILYLTIPLVLMIVLASFAFMGPSEKEVEKFERIRHHDLLFYLTERGTLKASRFVQITSPILSNRAKIVEMRPEGSLVDKGEIIARFDIKPFMDDINTMRFKIKEANANLVNAQKELEIATSENIEAIKSIKASMEIAKIKLNDIIKGSGRIKEMELKQAVKQEKRKLVMAENELKDFTTLYQKGYISKREKEKVSDKVKEATESLLAAKDRLKNYQTYEWQKSKKEQNIHYRELENKLMSTKEQNRLSVENKKAQSLKFESLLRHYTNELEKAKKNVIACDVRAPISGTLLYNIIPKIGKKAKVEIGDSIWYNQSFMQIPDTDNMVVNTLIKEVDLRFLQKGQKVKIILDAYPDRPLFGRVSFIDSIARNKGGSSVRYFETVITVDNTDTLLRSGMSATVEIIYERLKGVFSIPAEAIHQRKGTTYLLVREKDGKIVEHAIVIDKIAKDFVTIKDVDRLLAIGDEVVIRE